MIEVITVMCIIPVHISLDYVDTIVTQGRVIESDSDHWKIDFYDSLKAGGYDMKLNTGVKTLNSNNCILNREKNKSAII